MLFCKTNGKGPVKRHAWWVCAYLVENFTGLSSNLLVGAEVVKQLHCRMNRGVFRGKIVTAVHLYDENRIGAGKQSLKNGCSLGQGQLAKFRGCPLTSEISARVRFRVLYYHGRAGQTPLLLLLRRHDDSV